MGAVPSSIRRVTSGAHFRSSPESSHDSSHVSSSTPTSGRRRGRAGSRSRSRKLRSLRSKEMPDDGGSGMDSQMTTFDGAVFRAAGSYQSNDGAPGVPSLDPVRRAPGNP